MMASSDESTIAASRNRKSSVCDLPAAAREERLCRWFIAPQDSGSAPIPARVFPALHACRAPFQACGAIFAQAALSFTHSAHPSRVRRSFHSRGRVFTPRGGGFQRRSAVFRGDEGCSRRAMPADTEICRQKVRLCALRIAWAACTRRVAVRRGRLTMSNRSPTFDEVLAAIVANQRAEFYLQRFAAVLRSRNLR